VKQLAEYPIC